MTLKFYVVTLVNNEIKKGLDIPVGEKPRGISYLLDATANSKACFTEEHKDKVVSHLHQIKNPSDTIVITSHTAFITDLIQSVSNV